MVEEAADAAAAGFAVLDGEEKEVMVAFALGFLAVEVAMSPALRLRGVAMARARAIPKNQLTGGKGIGQMESTSV